MKVSRNADARIPVMGFGNQCWRPVSLTQLSGTNWKTEGDGVDLPAIVMPNPKPVQHSWSQGWIDGFEVKYPVSEPIDCTAKALPYYGIDKEIG